MPRLGRAEYLPRLIGWSEAGSVRHRSCACNTTLDLGWGLWPAFGDHRPPDAAFGLQSNQFVLDEYFPAWQPGDDVPHLSGCCQSQGCRKLRKLVCWAISLANCA